MPGGSPPRSGTSLEISPHEPLRVLLVEDDLEYGRMVERVLRRGRPPVWVHREARLDAALRRLALVPYDALVVDLKLPDAAGRSTLESACALAGRLPVVVLTGTEDDALALEAIRGGAEDYLVKQRTHALSLPGAVVRAIERHRRRTPPSDARVAPPAGDPTAEVQLLDHLGCALARVRRRSEALAVMAVGYADLHWLADSFGAAGTERIVAHAAARLALRVRRGDLLARLDRSRFALVIEGSGDTTRWEAMARGIRRVLESLATEVGEGVEVGRLRARVGISLHPEDGDDPETLLENALVAWERSHPRGGVAFYASGGAEPEG